jgi:hypothetical protein
VLDQIVAPIKPAADTEWVKHERIQSKLLTEFWGRPMYLGAHVLLPKGWAEHPKARYPLMINHGHFPDDFGGFRPEAPDPQLAPDYSERFRLKGYNRLQQDLAHQLYKDWTGPGFPRVIAIEIQHANPYYDDSYAVNSENLGPYADAIQQELIPYLERKYRAIGAGWARFVYGGSTGGWEAMAVQVTTTTAPSWPVPIRSTFVRMAASTSTRTATRMRSMRHSNRRHASPCAITSADRLPRSKK